MGGGASGPDFVVTQEQLDEAVAGVLSHTFDRVHIRAHYAKVLSNKEIDARISFKIISGREGDTPVLPESLLSAVPLPSETSFFARRTSNNPDWNQEELLLYQREATRKDTACISNSNVSSRMLMVRLEDVKDRKEMFLDHITTMAESTQRFFLRNIERFMTDYDVEQKTSPLIDTAEEDIDGNMISTVENIDEVHTIPLPAPDEGWVFRKLQGDHAVVYISLRTSLAEYAHSSLEDLRKIERRMTEVKLTGLSHGNNALLRHIQAPANKRAILWIPGFNDSFHNHTFVEGMMNEGYDIWLLDLRRCGACRRAFPGGTAPLDYHHASDLREYFEEVHKAMDIIKSREPAYDNIVGYAHSTGGLVLLEYALEFTDSEFSGFVFNSPFLDWGYIAGQLININMVDKNKEGISHPY